ncbi:MAG: hypothetical protein WCH57_05705 [Verrucomicrobiota bacterium]
MIDSSGFGTEEDVQQSLAAGFKEHLVTPVHIAALRAAIQRIVSEHPPDPEQGVPGFRREGSGFP